MKSAYKSAEDCCHGGAKEVHDTAPDLPVAGAVEVEATEVNV